MVTYNGCPRQNSEDIVCDCDTHKGWYRKPCKEKATHFYDCFGGYFAAFCEKHIQGQNIARWRELSEEEFLMVLTMNE